MGYFVKSGISGVIATGTTAERPVSPIESVLRYNTETQSFEYWNGTIFASLAVVGSTRIKKSTFLGNGSDTVFTMLVSVDTPKEALVFVNGVFQEPATHYTVSGFTLTLGGIVPSGEIITVIHGLGNTLITANHAIDITQ